MRAVMDHLPGGMPSCCLLCACTCHLPGLQITGEQDIPLLHSEQHGFAPPIRTVLTLLQVELHPGLAEASAHIHRVAPESCRLLRHAGTDEF